MFVSGTPKDAIAASGVNTKFAKTAMTQVVAMMPYVPISFMYGRMVSINEALIPVEEATKPMDMQVTKKKTNLKLMVSISSFVTTPNTGNERTAGSSTKI